MTKKSIIAETAKGAVKGGAIEGTTEAAQSVIEELVPPIAAGKEIEGGKLLKNVVDFCHRIKIARPKVSILSATEEVLDSMQSSLDAKEICELAEKESLNADIFGPLAFDNSVSKKSAEIKGIKNIVAGDADVLLVPNVETGNALVKMMIYFMGACAAGVVIGGKVPVVITSRSDDATARLASIAAAVVALD